MKQNLIMDIVQGMLPYLNNAQTQRLQEVLQHTLFDYEVAKTESDKGLSEQNLVELFLSAKRIEGCSEKTLKYYKATIQAMIDSIGKCIKYIVTDDIRCYLTEYQSNEFYDQPYEVTKHTKQITVTEWVRKELKND